MISARRRPLLVLAGAGVVAALAVLPGARAGATFTEAAKTDPVRFATPSRNIGCVGMSTDVRCDIASSRAPRPPRPKNCRGDWGNAFAVERTGRGHGLCASDTVLPGPNDPVRILRYGTTIRLGGGLSCTSRRAGLTCRNRGGHGFFLSKQRIRLF